MKPICLFLLFCFPGFFWAQPGRIVILDAKTNAPIPFSQVSNTQKTIGFTTGLNGQFSLDSLRFTSDTVIISCIGYSEKTVSRRVLDVKKEVQLEPLKQLDEVVVSAKKTVFKEAKMGVTRKARRIDSYNAIHGTKGSIQAYWIQNDRSLRGTIEQVQVYVTDKGYPGSWFRIHLYECAPVSIRPGKEMTTRNLIVKAAEGNEWVKTDVRDMHLRIPENGFFIGVEWLPETEKEEYKDTINYTDREEKKQQYIRVSHGFAPGMIFEKYKYSKYKCWIKWSPEKEWYSVIERDESRFNKRDTVGSRMHRMMVTNENNLYYGILCAHADVKYIKEKNEIEYESPEKRVLNKIERVKKDLFKYPQNSVGNLFNSLIKAFENDDILYVLKYLCVYKDDDLQDILDSMDTSDPENMLSQTERGQIVNYLTKIRSNMADIDIKETSPSCYSMEANGELFNLVLEKGVWKLYPYTERTEGVPIFRNIEKH